MRLRPARGRYEKSGKRPGAEETRLKGSAGELLRKVRHNIGSVFALDNDFVERVGYALAQIGATSTLLSIRCPRSLPQQSTAGRTSMATIKLKYVDKITDRYKRDHYYFRHMGRRVPLPGEPLSTEFMAAYSAALDSVPAASPRPQRGKPTAGTFAALAALYFASANYLNLSPSSRRNYKRVIDSFLVVHGNGRLDQFRRRHMVKIIGDMSDIPGAAIVLLKRVRTLVRFAIDLEWITSDPTTRVRSYKSKEIHTWTEAEIEKFETHWPLGTRQRLAFDVLLFTGQRGSDAHKMIRPDKRGKIRVAQQKTGALLSIATHPHLAESIAAVDATDARRHSVMLATAYGAPFSVKGFGQFVSAAIVDAGLPSRCKAHGLRKAAARRLAEVGCSVNQIMSVTGHRTLAEIERYTRAASQESLNEGAMKQLGNTRLPNSAT